MDDKPLQTSNRLMLLFLNMLAATNLSSWGAIGGKLKRLPLLA